MWLRSLSAAAAAAAALTAGPALACSCAPFRSPAEHLAGADLVFKGRVLRSSGDQGRAVTTFRVDEVLKGRTGQEVDVRHAVSSAACGVKFARGGSRLVFAYRGRGGYSTNSCSQARFPEGEYRAALRADP